MNKIEQIKGLTAELLHHCHLYYDMDAPEISDAEYDKKYDALKQLEDEEGFWLANSPTRKVQGTVFDGFQKATHSKPMLSAAKTKDIKDIKKFVGNNNFYCSYKLDGLTLVTIYEGGEFKKAITRGTGLVGEDVTEQAKMIANLPIHIPYDDYLELRGECVVAWDDFHKINEKLNEPYSHPRNLAAGSLRNLDTNITKQRKLSYVVFECVSGCNEDHKLAQLDFVCNLGFETVNFCGATVERCVEIMKPEDYKYPVDGLIFEYCSNAYSQSLSATSHHEGCRMALKWADSAYETTLRDVIWDVGRSGVISPVAVFDEVDLDGALTTRATLHNLSIIENLELGIGDTITVYRSNMVIPKIDDNLTRSNSLIIPGTCPCCGSRAEIKYTDNSKFLMCVNPNCSAKTLAKFTHFVSRNCANIDGLSEKTLEALISNDFLRIYRDIYYLSEHRQTLTRLEGMGEKSVSTLLKSIENSRNIKLANFINAIGIPNVGLSTAKDIAVYFDNDILAFLSECLHTNYASIEGIGEKTANGIKEWFDENYFEVFDLAKEFEFATEENKVVTENPFNGKTLCVTGKLFNFTRDSINTKIAELGAKSAGSVSKNTDYLITNEASGSSKYKKAVELNIPIITEQEFLNMIGD